MKLIEMTDFVLEQKIYRSDSEDILQEIVNYAKFLKQPLKLEMFVPCDDNGSVLEHPIYTTNHSDECYCKGCEEETKRCSDLQDQYQKAKEKVLFKGFENFEFKVYDKYIKITDKESLNSECFSTVEHLIDNHLIRDIYLTESAIKQIGL